MYRVLLVDDKKYTVSFLVNILKVRGWEAVLACSGEEAFQLFTQSAFDIVVTDICMEPMSGLDLLQKIRGVNSKTPVILMTGHEDFVTGVQALSLGAFDYLTKPFDVHLLLATLNRALAYYQALTGRIDLSLVVGSYHRWADIVAVSRAMRDVCEAITRVAPAELPVLLRGEKGVGKELIARTIHAMGPRREKPFVCIHCEALPAEWHQNHSRADMFLADLAAHGTLFLDGVDLLPPTVQTLVHSQLCQESEQDAAGSGGAEIAGRRPRLIASTTTDLSEKSRAGGFNEELAWRLVASVIEIPPLRERKEDILALLHTLLLRQVGKGGPLPRVDLEALTLIEHYVWPGNAGEMEEVVRAILPDGRLECIRPEDLPAAIRAVAADVPHLRTEDLKKEFLQGDALNRFLRSQTEKEKELLRATVAEKVKEDQRRIHGHLSSPG